MYLCKDRFHGTFNEWARSGSPVKHHFSDREDDASSLGDWAPEDLRDTTPVYSYLKINNITTNKQHNSYKLNKNQGNYFISELSTIETYARRINMLCSDNEATATKGMEAHSIWRRDTITDGGSKRFILIRARNRSQ